MPGGDRTGPMGAGSRTGRGAGNCAGYDVPGYANTGFGSGMGFGRRIARGRGFGRGMNVTWNTDYDYHAVPMDSKQEAIALKNGVKSMEEEIKQINEKIKELEK